MERLTKFDPRPLIVRSALALSVVGLSLSATEARANNSFIPGECKGPSNNIEVDGVRLGGCYSSDAIPEGLSVQKAVEVSFAPSPEQCAGRVATITNNETEQVVRRCLTGAPDGVELRNFILQTAEQQGAAIEDLDVTAETKTPDGQSMGGSASATNVMGGNSFSRKP